MSEPLAGLREVALAAELTVWSGITIALELLLKWRCFNALVTSYRNDTRHEGMDRSIRGMVHSAAHRRWTAPCIRLRSKCRNP